MHKSFFVVLALVLLLICSIVEGADWKLYGRTADGCNYYYDVSSVKTLSKGIKKVWTKTQADNNKCILALIRMRTEYGHSIGMLRNRWSISPEYAVQTGILFDVISRYLNSGRQFEHTDS